MAVKTELANVHFDIVGGCQLRCVGCPNSTILNKVRRIDPSVFGSCLRNIDVDHVAIFRLFNYGESLLHDDLPSIFDELESAPSFSIGHLELSTNAQFAHWDQLEDALRRRRVTRLVVSCDGDGTPASYERMRPPAKWEKLIAFLVKARELRDRLCPDMELMTRTVVFDHAHTATWKAVLEPLGWRPEFRWWINLVGAAEDLSGRIWEPGQGMCPFVGAGDSLYVDADGTVVPCCAHPRAGDFGNLATERWSTLVASAKRADFVAKLQTDRTAMDICGKCEFGSKSDLASYFVAEQVG
ncbi:MAG TPA: SPASM domain-containing protein [Vicinamibacterales bacterium]|jgi:radical SAM protein with 4Fe4S-binding SPASM domain|nr:SPASM domain-containing protein [Vicinamibacterales bacterium]